MIFLGYVGQADELFPPGEDGKTNKSTQRSVIANPMRRARQLSTAARRAAGNGIRTIYSGIGCNP
jgi:hypothetical protein